MGRRIDTTALRVHTAFLADDRLRGRATGSAGSDLAAFYVESVCRALGLTPVDSAFDLPVPLARASTDSVEVVVEFAGDSLRFQGAAALAVLGETAAALRDVAGPAVMVGDAEHVREGRLPSLRGAVAIVLGVLAPGPEIDTLRAAGAAGVLQLTGDSTALRVLHEGPGNDVVFDTDPTVVSSYFPNLPSMVLGASGSHRLVERLGMLRPGPIGAVVQFHLHMRAQPLAARNVGCLRRGASAAAADSAIVFTAHYDHLGVGRPDERGDSIYNGFSDNAAGVAMLLAIADAMGRSPEPPRHSTVFLFFTGEEDGLLGSDYYVAHPAWPLRRTLGVINLDAGAPPARVWSWRIAGGDHSALGRLAVDVALARGWSAVTSGPRANSDYFPFYRVGIPAIFLVPGPAPYEGLSADSSQALRRHWDHYHQPADEWHADFPFAGLARYAEFALLIGESLDRRGLPHGEP